MHFTEKDHWNRKILCEILLPGETEWLFPCKRAGNRMHQTESRHRCLWFCISAFLSFVLSLEITEKYLWKLPINFGVDLLYSSCEYDDLEKVVHQLLPITLSRQIGLCECADAKRRSFRVQLHQWAWEQILILIFF